VFPHGAPIKPRPQCDQAAAALAGDVPLDLDETAQLEERLGADLFVLHHLLGQVLDPADRRHCVLVFPQAVLESHHGSDIVRQRVGAEGRVAEGLPEELAGVPQAFAEDP
jgi:hypothetical protein